MKEKENPSAGENTKSRFYAGYGTGKIKQGESGDACPTDTDLCEKTDSASDEGIKADESEYESGNDTVKKEPVLAPKSFIEILPSKAGTILAALLSNIMSEGLTADQKNILGNFISSVGSLISYKSSRDEIDNN